MDQRDYMSVRHPQQESVIVQRGAHNVSQRQRGQNDVNFIHVVRPLAARQPTTVQGTHNRAPVPTRVEPGAEVIVVNAFSGEGVSLLATGNFYGAETVDLLVRDKDLKGNVTPFYVACPYGDLDTSWEEGCCKVTVQMQDLMAATGLNEEVKRQVLRRYPNLQRQDAKALQEHLQREMLQTLMEGGAGGGRYLTEEGENKKYKEEVARLRSEWASKYDAIVNSSRQVDVQVAREKAAAEAKRKAHQKKRYAMYRDIQKKYNALRKKYGKKLRQYSDALGFTAAVSDLGPYPD